MYSITMLIQKCWNEKNYRKEVCVVCFWDTTSEKGIPNLSKAG